MADEKTDKLEADQCFTVYRGRVHAVLNWRHRRGLGDAIVSRPLTKEELALYKEKRSEGLDDAAVFAALFPPVISQSHTRQELMKLSKNRLIHLIINRLHCSLPSLKNMTKADLCTLYMHLGQARFSLSLAETKEKGR